MVGDEESRGSIASPGSVGGSKRSFTRSLTKPLADHDYGSKTASKAFVDGHVRTTRTDTNLERPADTLLAKLNAKRKAQLNRLGGAGENQILSPRRGKPTPSSPKASIHSTPRAPRGFSGRMRRPLPGEETMTPSQLALTEEAANRPATTKSLEAKEDMLERFMSVDAQQTFAVVARHQLNKGAASRVCLDVDRLNPADIEKVCKGLAIDHTEEDAMSDLDDDGGDESQQASDTARPSLRFKVAPHVHWEEQTSGGFAPNTSDCFGRIPQGIWRSCGYACPAVQDNVGVPARNPMDRVFAARHGQYKLVGLVNSHGAAEKGCQLAELVAEMMPDCLFRSAPLVKHQDAEQALVSAFRRVHWRASRQLDLRLTGASLTVLLQDDVARCIWIAHVGECRAVLGTPDDADNAQEFHYRARALTADHKLSCAKEFDRVVAAGGDVRRQVGDSMYRLFAPNGDLPGTILTRSLGDMFGHSIGMSHVPAISCLKADDVPPGSFIVLGSAGVWSTMAERTTATWVGKNFATPGEAAMRLGQEALKRWEDGQTRNRLCLGPLTPDCFSIVVLRLKLHELQQPVAQNEEEEEEEEADEVSVPRRFVIGPGQVSRRDWSEVMAASKRMLPLPG